MKVWRAREIRLKDSKWQWVERSTTSGRILRILLENDELKYLKMQIEGWMRSENKRKGKGA